MLSLDDAKERAACGAALLDERYPAWREKIDLEALNLIDPDDCVLGQVYGSYDRGTEVLFGMIGAMVIDVGFAQIVRYGFSVLDVFDFSVLQRAWVTLLEGEQHGA